MKNKIIYISHWRFPSEKTMSPLIMRTCEGFVKEGFTVELWIPKRPDPNFDGVDPFAKYGIKERFPVRILPSFGLIEWLGKFGFIFMVMTFNIRVMWKLISERKLNIPTIIYGHDLRDFILPSLLGLPLFVEIHDFYESSLKMVNRFVLGRTSGLIVTNTFKQKAIVSHYGFPMEKMIRQPNAVSFEIFDIPISRSDARKKLGLPLDVKIALYAGHLFSWKGVYTFAEASLYLPENTYVYLVGGTVEDRSSLEAFADEKKLPRIVFLPHQEYSLIPLFLKAADVLVLPNTAKELSSKYETSPVKLFEYMASGAPVVASDLPSIREIVSEKEVSFFTADDPSNLATVISAVIKGSDEINRKSILARDLAKTCSWESRSRAISDLVRKYSYV